ncbi:MAG: YggT family protein [Candidatus Marinimicrobia bacterium]|jgi:YggT family protein|nr:YggT family protein [Candidatus Neomarinimicrobiota bacterium]
MNSLLISIIQLAFQILYICLIARVVVSWFNIYSGGEVIRWIYNITDPIIRPIQQIIPPMGIGIDFSPLIAIFVLGFIKKALIWAII